MGGIFSSALVEIRAAEGGDDAKLLVGDIFQMYSKWCRIKGFEIEVSYTGYGKIGFSRIEFVASGKDVYETFLPESGGHRVQRVPPTEKKGRRQTSTVTVAVLPMVSDIQCLIDDKDLTWDIFCSSGPGGQHRNKVETAARVTHKPSGISVVCCDEKSQKRNKDRALEVLRARLYAKNLKESLDKENSDRKQQIGKGQRGDKIRTYRFQDDIVVDHKTGKKANLASVVAGNIDILR